MISGSWVLVSKGIFNCIFLIEYKEIEEPYVLETMLDL